jgi:hypothetical protein
MFCESLGAASVIAWFHLTTTQLLALIAVNFAPMKRCRDRRWRSVWNNFPVEGVDDEDIWFLRGQGLLETSSDSAVVTLAGRSAIEAQTQCGAFRMPAAKGGTRETHLSLQ